MKQKVKVRVSVTVKVKVRTKTLTYFEKTVPESQVPKLVAKGALYPVPKDGCSGGGTPV